MKEKKDFIVSNIPTFLANRKPNSDDQKNKRGLLSVNQSNNFVSNYRTLEISAIPESVSIHFRQNSLDRKTTSENYELKQNTVKKTNSNKNEQIPPQPETPIFIYPTPDKKFSKSAIVKDKISCKLAKSHHEDKKNSDKCFNHEDVKAEYEIYIDKRIIRYCEKCAAKLISQDFEIHRYLGEKQFSKVQTSHTNITSQHTHGKEHVKNVQWQYQLQNCLNDIKIIRQKHLQTISQCRKVEKVYSEQIQHFQRFYSSLIQTVLHYKNQHLKGLKKESLLLSKQFTKQICNLQKAVHDLDQLSNEIRMNKEDILSSENESIFKSCTNYYYQTATIMAKKASYISNETKFLPNYSLSQLQETVSQLDTKILNLISNKKNKAKSLFTCIKPINLKLKQSHNRKYSEIKRADETKHRRSCTNVLDKQNNSLRSNEKTMLQISKHRKYKLYRDDIRTISQKKVDEERMTNKFLGSRTTNINDDE